MRHFVIVGILVLVMTVLTILGLNNAGLMPVQASAQALSIDWMWDWEVVVMSFLFWLIIAPMIYTMIVFRRKKDDTSDAEHMEGNTTLEISWTALPLILVVIFAYMGAYSLGEIRRIEPTAMVIKVRAQQFSWTFEYPEYGGIVSEELYLPVDRPVVLKMESRDVIHSFWVPEFRVKQDVVPGRVTEYRITPTLIGNYKVRCAELCGASHYNMERDVIVTDDVKFDAWVMEQQAVLAAALQTPEGQGQLLVVRNGCTGCHSVDGTRGTGPTWFNLYGSVVPLNDGSTVIADDAFIHESIVDPNAKIVAGFPSPSLMPRYEFTDEEIANIIAYIQTLK
jgi:cytochrome c oxidase subunit 2